MSASSQVASGFAGDSLAPLALMPPRGLGARLATLGPVMTVALKVRQVLDALKGVPQKPPQGEDSQKPQEDHAAADGIWDDPTLWILILR